MEDKNKDSNENEECVESLHQENDGVLDVTSAALSTSNEEISKEDSKDDVSVEQEIPDNASDSSSAALVIVIQ